MFKPYQTLHAFLDALKIYLPADQIFTDPLSCHAYAHDASHYLLIPQVVVKIETEAEVMGILQLAGQFQIAITFRAAGTSLSGQALSDSVLVVLGNNWRSHTILEAGQKIRLQPGVIGSEANLFLAAFGRKIGPDPASLHSAKIGGIAANNASGMCCGIAQNTYHTLAGIRVLFADGSILDTEHPEDFANTHPTLLQELSAIRSDIEQDPELTQLIQHQYRLKNTLGYSLNAFLDFADPLEILSHLMIGSEGTLGFIASITYHTVPNFAFEAAALLLFNDIETACIASLVLPREDISAIELMDERALKAVKFAVEPQQVVLLVDVKAASQKELEQKIEHLSSEKMTFITDRTEYNKIWALRRGILPAVAALRKRGTSMINEDVAVDPVHLPQFCHDLNQLFRQHGYEKSCIFGHVKEGNLHFLLEADFETPAGIAQYDGFMQALVELVLRYGGALKAEHGTGRNMAPFVEKAWGEKAYRIMARIKALLDPQGILNPDVILSKNPTLHLEHLKPLSPVDPLIDRCIECGFCEKVCPSQKLTLTPRQRIVALRDMQRLGIKFDDFQYRGLDTCAATGLCKTACPVGINTGDMVRKKRFQAKSKWQFFLARLWIRHFALVMKCMKLGMKFVTKQLPHPDIAAGDRQDPGQKKIYYFPSCSARLFNNDQQQILAAILVKLGFQLQIIPGFENQCCGLMFKSKGYLHEAVTTAQHLEKFLESREGPILCEMGSCVLQMQHSFRHPLPVYDVLEFLAEQLQNYPLKQQDKTVMLHITCSMQRLGLAEQMLALAKRCAKNVIVPLDIHCCGFAGEKGFTYPELNASALSTLKDQIPAHCSEAYSMSLTCEIGLSKTAGIPYRSLLYLIESALPT